MTAERTQLGLDLEEAFAELAPICAARSRSRAMPFPRAAILTPERVKAIRCKVASSTKEFERRFKISARTMEAYEQGRRRPDAAMRALLRVIDREPDAVRRALDTSTRQVLIGPSPIT